MQEWFSYYLSFQARGYQLTGLDLSASDPDNNAVLTYSLGSTSHSYYFRLDSGPVIAVDEKLDYENPEHPRMVALGETLKHGLIV